MNELIDPETIGEKRAASSIRMGWHVGTGLALQDALVGPDFVVVNVKMSDGQTDGCTFRRDEYVWTRTPAEQVAYVEACHRKRIAEASLASAVLSARPAPPCTRHECAKTRWELRQLRARQAASRIAIPVLQQHAGVSR